MSWAQHTPFYSRFKKNIGIDLSVEQVLAFKWDKGINEQEKYYNKVCCFYLYIWIVLNALVINIIKQYMFYILKWFYFLWITIT